MGDCEIDGVEDEAELIVGNDGDEPIVAIGDPLEFCLFVASANQGVVGGRL